MKEHPILFSTPMVQAILEGRKTQTRRIIKKQPHGAGKWARQLASWLFPNINPYIKLKCLYGQPGDKLWVRETWAIKPPIESEQDWITYMYKATPLDGYDIKWKPSIFMPREACRILLEVTDVRVERLQDITEEDAKAEGVYYYGWDDPEQNDYKDYTYNNENCDDWGLLTAKESYQTLWESINGKRSWEKNPWVWVIEFKRIDKGPELLKP